MPPRKVLVIGIDGATFEIIRPMFDAGKLPVIGSLMKRGAWGELESTIPSVTIPAWVSMLTGKNPGKLGLYDLLQRDGYSVKPNVCCYSKHEPLWDILNRNGIRTGLINIPGSYPPSDVDGFMITGMMTPSKRSQFCYPPTLCNEIDTATDGYEIDVGHWESYEEKAYLENLIAVTEKRGKAAKYLLQVEPCDFNMIVFTSSDRLHHALWANRDAVETYWEKLDSVIGSLLEGIDDDTTTFIVSDHGFSNLVGTFYVNEWLHKKGYLKLKRNRIRSAFVKLGQLVEGFFKFLVERKLLKFVSNFFYELLGIDRMSKYTYSYLSNVNLESRVNWKGTRAFSCIHTPEFGHIYLNMKDKMEEGIVTKEQREELRDSIIKELQELSLPEPKTKIEVFRSEEIYSGEYLDDAPDIVFMINGGRFELDGKVGEGKMFVEGAPLTEWTGTHVQEGVFIAEGPLIKPGEEVKISILDITPTILHIFGIQSPTGLDGEARTEILNTDISPKKETASPLKQDQDQRVSLSQEELTVIEARLKKLGYMG